MNYNSMIKNALAPLNIPVSWQTKNGDAPTYITFFCYNEQGEAWAADKEIEIGYYLQVDLWHKGNNDLSSIKQSIKTNLYAEGFTGFTAQELYESDTKIRHIAIRCNYIENLQ